MCAYAHTIRHSAKALAGPMGWPEQKGHERRRAGPTGRILVCGLKQQWTLLPGVESKQKQTERINVFRAFFNVKGHIKYHELKIHKYFLCHI